MTPQEARAAANVIGTQLQHEWMTRARVIAAIPEANKDWKPEPKSRSAWDLAVHLAGADVWFCGMKNPAIVYMNFALVHGVHHRGQLSGYLRPMGGTVPSIYGGSADETWQGPTGA